MDVPADEMVHDCFEQNKEKLLYHYLRMNARELEAAKPHQIRDFLMHRETIPEGFSADPERIRRGQALFQEYAAEIMMLLGAMALPYCYAGSPGNKALYLSDKMRQQPGKRLFDTGTFVLAVSQPGHLEKGELTGIVQIHKTRLIHAIARYYLLKSEWDDRWGAPINQEDMAGTNLAFSYIILNGLRMSGFRLSDDQKEDYLHLWNYIGLQLGIDPHLLPADYQEAFLLTKRIRERNFRYSEEGEILARELINYYKKVAPASQASLISAQIRYFLGPKIAGYIGLDDNKLRDNLTNVINGVRAVRHNLQPHASTYEQMLRQYQDFQASNP
jgi:hypothetical protein